MKISAHNQLAGTVQQINKGAVMAEVSVTLDDRPAEQLGWFATNVHKVYEVCADDCIR